MNPNLPQSVLREVRWSRELAQGTRGLEVRRVQEWLCLHGCATSIDGDFGPATAAALKRFQASQGLPSTGIVTLSTLEALSHPLILAFGFAPAVSNLRAAVCAVAGAHLAQHPREVGGDNRGPWVRAYCAADGIDYRWCAGSALSIVRQACELIEKTMPVKFTLSCDELAESAHLAHRFSSIPNHVEAGDLFLVRRTPTDWIHTGIITAVRHDHFETIEGNTNDDGSANGYELCARTRSFGGKDFVLLN